MNTLIIISLDDWEGIYYEGRLITEGHKIGRFELVGYMEKYNTFRVHEFWLNEKGEKLINEQGSLPDSFKEIEQFLVTGA